MSKSKFGCTFILVNDASYDECFHLYDILAKQ